MELGVPLTFIVRYLLPIISSMGGVCLSDIVAWQTNNGWELCAAHLQLALRCGI